MLEQVVLRHQNDIIVGVVYDTFGLRAENRDVLEEDFESPCRGRCRVARHLSGSALPPQAPHEEARKGEGD